MKIFNNFRGPGSLKRPILTWGVFDGVHRGHHRLINSVIQWATRTRSDSLVITFDNHPARVLNLQSDPLFITSLAHRLLLLEKLAVDATLVLNFTRKLSQLSAEDFVTRIIKTLNPGGVVVTDNISFGRNRAGNIQTLKEILGRQRIPLKIIKTLKYKGQTISSSLIRRAIKAGDLKTAKAMLGRPVAILGTVVHGEGRGRKLGFPTANLDPHHEILPRRGVYIARAFCLKGCRKFTRPFKALVNIGIKPTFHPKFKGHHQENIEVFLLNYDIQKRGSLYGRDILVEIIRHLRAEKKFATPDLLIKQIKKDIRQAKEK
ncbi:MAG: riboflavin biosynthesis protein RibF [Planctomycetota bacterium]|mgnify:CR=1 FL=1